MTKTFEEEQIKINWNKLYDIISKPRREASGGPIYVCMSDLLEIV